MVTRLRVVGVTDMGEPIVNSKDTRLGGSRRYLIVMFRPVVSLRTMQLSVPSNKAVVFLSDVHLGLGDRATDRRREDRLLGVLRWAAAEACHVFIVGDLFDLWFDWRTVIPKGHVRTLAALDDLVAGGVGVTYLMGNHDFGHYRYFREELGIEVDAGDIDLRLNNTRLYVCHGDGKAHNDLGYLVLRSVLRNPIANWLYRKIHPDWGIGLASSTSKGSRDHTSHKDYGPHDGLRDFAYARIDEGYDVVVMGHRHRAAAENHGRGTYVNLGHWLDERATYGVFRPNEGLRLVEVE